MEATEALNVLVAACRDERAGDVAWLFANEHSTLLMGFYRSVAAGLRQRLGLADRYGGLAAADGSPRTEASDGRLSADVATFAASSTLGSGPEPTDYWSDRNQEVNTAFDYLSRLVNSSWKTSEGIAGFVAAGNPEDIVLLVSAMNSGMLAKLRESWSGGGVVAADRLTSYGDSAGFPSDLVAFSAEARIPSI